MKLIKIGEEELYNQYRLVISEPSTEAASVAEAQKAGETDSAAVDSNVETIAGAELVDNAMAAMEAMHQATLEHPMEISEPITKYEKIFQQVAQSIIDQVAAYNGGPFYVEFIISEQNKAEDICAASIMSLGASGESLVCLDDDSSEYLESELSFISLKGYSAWTDYIGIINLTVQIPRHVLAEYGKEHLTLLHSIAAQAYCTANDCCKFDTDDVCERHIYMGGFQPC